MNSNPPHDDTPIGTRYVVIHINKVDKNCLVRKETGGKSFICELSDWLIDGIMLMDYVTIKHAANGKQIVTDYHVNTDFYDDEYVEVVS